MPPSYHFRFPWRSRGSQVKPDPYSGVKTKNPAQTTTSAPVERPPFRPAGKAPVKASPSQAQAPLKIEPPPPSPSRSATESQKSFSATTQTRVEVDSSPSSPSRAESPSPATQPEPKEPYAEISTSETIPKAQNNTPTAEQTHAASKVAVETVASTEKADPDTVGGDQKHHAESEAESKEHEEREKALQAVIKEEWNNDPGYKELMQETATQLHAAVTDFGEHARDLLGVVPKAEQRHKKQETFDRNETLASTTSSSKPTKTPKGRSTSRVPIQKTVSLTAEQASPHKEIKEDALEMTKLATEDQMLEKPVSGVVTLSGENRGATMHKSSEPENGDEFMPIHRSYKTNPDDSLEATTDGEESSEGKNFDQTSKDQHRIAYINSNVQSINNCIVFNTSVTERNPGVQSVFSIKPAESIKLTPESTVRRRCL